nr:MAG: hypothetical protein [Sanya fiers-like virus 14]
MSKQTQPRPPISKRHLSTYRYRRIDKVVNGVKYFKYYDTSIETLNEQKSFATYVLSRNGTKPLNRTLSPLIETKARRWPLVTWRTNPDNTDLNYAPYPITDAYTKNIGRIQDVAVARAVASIKDAKVDLLTLLG